MNPLFSLCILLQLLPADRYVKALSTTTFDPWNGYKFFAISAPVCIDPTRARESDLERVDYHDCIPVLNEILLDPNVNHENQYDATNAYQVRIFRTCSIALRPRLQVGTDIFWGYQIATAAAAAVQSCVEDSLDPYGGLVFTTPRRYFYAHVRSSRDRSTVEAFSTVTSEKASSRSPVLSTNSTNATLLAPDPWTAIPTCQISQISNQYLYPVRVLDCYYLFYSILTSPTLERLITMRGLSPVSYERYGTCNLQLRGFSAVSADAIRYVALLLGAVSIVQTCLVESSLVLGGAVSVGTRGQYFVRIFNPVEGTMGDAIQS